VRKVDGSGFIGYLEGEYVPIDMPLIEKPYRDLPVPFEVTRRRLHGPPTEAFRESELHLTLDKDSSDERLIRRLLEAGLYGAYLPKSSHTSLVLTAQGRRNTIGELFQILRGYLESAGGVVRGTLKEEIAIRHALFGITTAALPEVVDQLTFGSIR
jgi:hypothetical protein